MIRSEARLSALSGRSSDRAAAMHDQWARRLGIRCHWHQLTPDARSWWITAAMGVEMAGAEQVAA